MKLLITIVLLFSLKIADAQTLNLAERPLPQRNMPRFAKLMYQRDASKINFYAVEKAFKAWHKEELKDRKKDAFEENIYEEYYKRWARAAMPYVQQDGSIQWPTAEKQAVLDNERRQIHAEAVRQRQNAVQQKRFLESTTAATNAMPRGKSMPTPLTLRRATTAFFMRHRKRGR